MLVVEESSNGLEGGMPPVESFSNWAECGKTFALLQKLITLPQGMPGVNCSKRSRSRQHRRSH